MLSRMRFISTKCFLGLLAFILSCSTVDYPEIYSYKFNFVKSNKEPIAFKSKKKIAIQTFVDERKSENISYSALSIIPLMPYANEYYNKPEMTGHYGINFLPEIDLAKAMETELADYSLFEKVFYTDRTFPKDVDYLIRVRIKKNQIYNKETMYGIGAFLFSKDGFLYYGFFQIFKTDFYTIKVEFDLELIEIKTNQIVFQRKITTEKSDNQLVLNRSKISENFVFINEQVIQEMSKEIIQYFQGNKK